MSRLVSVMFGSQAGAATGLYGDSLLRAGRRTRARDPVSANSRARSCRSTDRVKPTISHGKEIGSDPPQRAACKLYTANPAPRRCATWLRPRHESFKERRPWRSSPRSVGDWRCQANLSMMTLYATQKNGCYESRRRPCSTYSRKIAGELQLRWRRSVNGRAGKMRCISDPG